MNATLESPSPVAAVLAIPVDRIDENPLSIALYGAPAAELGGLLDGVREHGVLVPLVVAPDSGRWQLLSGHRRLACARALGLTDVPCQVRRLAPGPGRDHAVIEYNRQRRKTFSQSMREADALESLLGSAALSRRAANLRQNQPDPSDRRDSDGRPGRTDAAVALAICLGGKDLYRQARAVWNAARNGDPRAVSGLAQLDAGTKSVHAAYKDLRRRGRFATNFRPTPYDVWHFRHDGAFGIPHPGSIPPGIVAHAVHYYCPTGGLVVDPMAGGGTTLDVCASMGRRCLAYDLHPVRPEISERDVDLGLAPETRGCDLVFCDPPYFSMLARSYAPDCCSSAHLGGWNDFLLRLARSAYAALRKAGHVALLLANQTEKDIPAGHGYIDHAFLGYRALTEAGFVPERRVSCPMDGAYLPQHVRRARTEGRMLGQVRDLLIMRKP